MVMDSVNGSVDSSVELCEMDGDICVFLRNHLLVSWGKKEELCDSVPRLVLLCIGGTSVRTVCYCQYLW